LLPKTAEYLILFTIPLESYRIYCCSYRN